MSLMGVSGCCCAGYLAAYDKEDGLRVVYDDEEAVLEKELQAEAEAKGPGGQVKAEPSTSSLALRERLARMPKHFINRFVSMPLEIEGMRCVPPSLLPRVGATVKALSER
jgi:hypothetical protein